MPRVVSGVGMGSPVLLESNVEMGNSWVSSGSSSVTKCAHVMPVFLPREGYEWVTDLPASDSEGEEDDLPRSGTDAMLGFAPR